VHSLQDNDQKSVDVVERYDICDYLTIDKLWCDFGIDKQNTKHHRVNDLALEELVLRIRSLDVLVDLLLKFNVLKELIPGALLVVGC